MYAKNQGLRATITYRDDDETIDVIVTNPQAGERADMQPFGARIFYANGTQTIIPISIIVAPITTEIVDVYVKMDEESEQYIMCPLDEVDAAIAFVEEQERIRAELEAAIAAENADLDLETSAAFLPVAVKSLRHEEEQPEGDPIDVPTSQIEIPALEVVEAETSEGS